MNIKEILKEIEIKHKVKSSANPPYLNVRVSKKTKKKKIIGWKRWFSKGK